MRRTSAGARGKNQTTANDIGAGPATVAPPSAPANTTEEKENSPKLLIEDLRRVADETTRESAGSDPVEGEGEEREIVRQYRGMLDGIRKLPRLLRPLARRQARDWLRTELKAAREKRKINRRAAREERLKQIRRRDALRRRPPGLNPS